MIDPTLKPIQVFQQRQQGATWVSALVSTNVAGLTSGSTVDVTDLKSLTAFVNRGTSTVAVELEASPDGANWWQWKNFAAGVALPAAGERASLEEFASGATVAFVRALPNVSATATNNAVVFLNGLTK